MLSGILGFGDFCHSQVVLYSWIRGGFKPTGRGSSIYYGGRFHCRRRQFRKATHGV